MAEWGHDIIKAKRILESGGLVAIPTETVYGLAANAYDPDAVAKIFEVKRRPYFDPLIVQTHGLEETESFATEIPKKAKKLAESFWPGPLTLLLAKDKIIPDLVTSGMERVAVRVPSHNLTESLLRSLDFPLVAPSANHFGYVSPTTAGHVNTQLGDEIDYILDGGGCHIGIESTIIGFENDQTIIYRLGGLEKEQIENVIGPVRVLPHSSSSPQAPGMLKSHYAPSKKVILGDVHILAKEYSNKKVGIIHFQGVAKMNGSSTQICLRFH